MKLTASISEALATRVINLTDDEVDLLSIACEHFVEELSCLVDDEDDPVEKARYALQEAIVERLLSKLASDSTGSEESAA